MVDFKAKLDAKRAKEKIDAQMEASLPPAPDMNPIKRERKSRKPKDEEEVLPELSTLVSPIVRLRIDRLIKERKEAHDGITVLEAEKLRLTDELKALCNQLHITKVAHKGIRINYYWMGGKSYIKKEKLLSHNVSMETIIACTDVSAGGYQLRITFPGEEEVEG